MNSTDKEQKAVLHPPSDGSELIPAEVQVNTRKEPNPPLDEPLGVGYTVDNEGLLNNYAIEPKMSKAEYPSPKQQRRYIFLGAVATLFVVLVIWLAFAVSHG